MYRTHLSVVDVSETLVSFFQHLDDTELISTFADFLAVEWVA